MLEIYNERFRDLLLEDGAAQPELKVRNGPKGTYVAGQRRIAVSDYAQIERAMERGSLNRTVASTNMNATSSRAHTVRAPSRVLTRGRPHSRARAAPRPRGRCSRSP